MVKIIKQGPDRSVVKEVICRDCGATLEYVPIDIKSRSYMEIDGCRDTLNYIICPQCNKEIRVG